MILVLNSDWDTIVTQCYLYFDFDILAFS